MNKLTELHVLKQNSPVEVALNGNYVPCLAHYAQQQQQQ